MLYQVASQGARTHYQLGSRRQVLLTAPVAGMVAVAALLGISPSASASDTSSPSALPRTDAPQAIEVITAVSSALVLKHIIEEINPAGRKSVSAYRGGSECSYTLRASGEIHTRMHCLEPKTYI